MSPARVAKREELRVQAEKYNAESDGSFRYWVHPYLDKLCFDYSLVPRYTRAKQKRKAA